MAASQPHELQNLGYTVTMRMLQEWAMLAETRHFIFQLGFQKCGSSLVSSLIDAHPNACMALNRTFMTDADPLSREQYFALLLEDSRVAAREGRGHDSYSYRLPGAGPEGKTNLIALGAKGAWDNAQLMIRDRNLFKRFEEKVQLPFKYIFCVRNPYDMISGVWNWKEHRRVNAPIDDVIDRFLPIAVENDRMLKEVCGPQDALLIRLEDLISTPDIWLQATERHLGLPNDVKWLADCTKLLFKKHQTIRRTRAPWTRGAVERVQKDLIEEFPRFFFGYKYE